MSAVSAKFTIDDVKIHMKRLAELITPNQSLIDAYLSEYYTKELCKCVRQNWWATLLEEEPENLATLLSPHTFRTRTVWPLSLLAHRKAAHSLALDRIPFELSYAQVQQTLQPNPTEGNNAESNDDSQEKDKKLNVSKDVKSEINDGQYKHLEHCYRRHVKPKKQHEISTLAQVIDAACSAKDLQNVVDVGAGQGHLSRLLTYGYNKTVTTIEADGCHIPKAKKFDSEVRRDIALGRTECTGKKLKKNRNNMKTAEEAEKKNNVSKIDNDTRPVHTVAWISEDLDWEQFIGIINKSSITSSSFGDYEHSSESVSSDSNIQEKIFEDKPEPKESSDFLLTGLHACGDLSPTMMRVFVKCPQAKCLASVSCCYMKLTTTSNRNGCSGAGYPMCEFARDHLQCPLSYEAREMACHFIDAYHQRLLDNSPNLKCHIYRAALQEIIVSKSPDKVHDSIKLTFKKSHQLSFMEYAQKALKRMGLDDSITPEQAQTAEDRLRHWKDIVAFYTLRLSFAPVVESLILLDRLLYLLENGMNAAVIPIFDPKLSPRNFIIIAGKP